MTTILHNSDLTSLFSRPCLEIKCHRNPKYLGKLKKQTKKYLSLLAYLIYTIYNAAYAELKILRRRCFDALPTAPPRLFTFSQENSGSGGNASFPNFCTFRKAREGFFVQFSSLAKSKDAGNKIWPGEYNRLCFSITPRKNQFIFTLKYFLCLSLIFLLA